MADGQTSKSLAEHLAELAESFFFSSNSFYTLVRRVLLLKERRLAATAVACLRKSVCEASFD